MNEFIIKNRKTLLITITLLLGITLTITFAYFANTVGDAANTDVDLTSQSSKSLIFNVEKTLSLVANIDNFADGDGSISDTAVASATLTKGSTEETSSEDYYVYFQINSNDYIYTTPDKKPEMILTIIDPDGNVVTDIDGYTPVTVTDAHTNETITGYDITELEDTIVIKSNYPITTTSVTKHDWTAKVTFVNLDTLQNDNQYKTMSAELVLSDERPSVPLNEMLQELHNGVDGTEGIYYTNNSEYRYTGATPNNYILFNDELWRIIGTFNENSHGQTGEMLTKIIRDESIGNLSTDTRNSEQYLSENYGKNDWSTSDLKYILNTSYLNSEDGTFSGHCYDGNTSTQGDCDYATIGIQNDSRLYIEEIIWKLGGTPTSIIVVQEIYERERGNAVFDERPINWIGKIGLMYPSDYGYAAINTCWSIDLWNVSSECKINNWLSENYVQRTITAHSLISSSFWTVSSTGKVDSKYANDSFMIRPVLYLKSNVKILSGTGTESNPFIIGL